MGVLNHRTVVEQAAEALRAGIAKGRWSARLPGSRSLAAELGVAKGTMTKAIRILEAEGLLAVKKPRESRTIKGIVSGKRRMKMLRIAVFVASGLENERGSSGENALDIVRRLQQAGHHCVIVSPSAPPSVRSLPSLVKNNPADAWVVYGAQAEVFRWFSTSGLEVIGIGGRCAGLPMAVAGYSIGDAREEVVRRLISLGHQRIVLLATELSRRPANGAAARLFRDQLEAAGIPAGEYNTPDWDETPHGFKALLESLFRFTPPTAILCMSDVYMSGLLSFLDTKKLSVPGDVSLFCMKTDKSLQWQRPGLDLAHCLIDHETGFIRIVRWVESLLHGKQDRETILTQARLHPGDSLGPAPK